MTGSNVHSASVMKHHIERHEQGEPEPHDFSVEIRLRNRDRCSHPGNETGTVIGYSSTGSSTSRLRARTSIAAKSVPTAANPTVPAHDDGGEPEGMCQELCLKQ